MYVRLAFAVAAHLEPDILVVDEVLSVGDADFQKKCLGKMGEVVGAGRTILFVSHNMQAVKSLCSRAVLLHEGKLVKDGEVESTIAHYLTLNSPADKDGLIDDSALRFGSGEAQLRRVALRNREGQQINQILLGQCFSLTMTFEVREKIDDAVVEVGISTMDGTRIATVHNIDRERPCFSLRPGLFEITVDLSITLLPREYVIDIALVHLQGLIIDWVDRTYRLTALNFAEGSKDHYRWGQVRGFVRPESEWKCHAA
jgi:lipopolysaccharide transport system ATP-binding protein